MLLVMGLLKFVFLVISTCSVTEGSVERRKPAVPAVIVFGDSTADPGNNNFISTPFTCNFPPYGKDLPSHLPTGRFSNGRLVPDFIAEYAGVKELIPPYLDPKLSLDELMTGVSFASGGSGFDPVTTKITDALPMQEQLDNFREYKSKLAQKIGKEKTEELISNALYVISAVTNDFIVSYIILKVRQLSYTVTDFEKVIVQYVHQFTKELISEGARKISIGGMPPIGCMPMLITFYSKPSPFHRGCIESYNSIARSYNKLLVTELVKIGKEVADQGVKVVYADMYNPVVAMIQQPDKFGLKNVNIGCCGTGYLEVTFACNSKSFVCPNASKYAFFDSIHPTERVYYNLFLSLRSGLDYLFED